MLSGIGPAAHLAGIGITPLVDLPVGRNLQDHLAVMIFCRRLDVSSFRKEMRFDRMAISMIRAYCFGTGPGTVVPGGLHAFVKTRPELAVPDIEFMFRGAPADTHLWFPLIRPAYVDGYGIRPTLLHPDSRGEILLRSTDPRDPPRIVYNFFSAPNDLPTLREGFKRARAVAYQQPMDPFRGAETSPGNDVKTDAEIDAFIRGLRSPRTIPAAPARSAATTPCSIRSCACAGWSACAWSMLPPCPISCRRISTPAF